MHTSKNWPLVKIPQFLSEQVFSIISKAFTISNAKTLPIWKWKYFTISKHNFNLLWNWEQYIFFHTHFCKTVKNLSKSATLDHFFVDQSHLVTVENITIYVCISVCKTKGFCCGLIIWEATCPVSVTAPFANGVFANGMFPNGASKPLK